MTASSKEREQFIAHLCKALPDKPAELIVHRARLLLRHAATHARLAEESCNGHPCQSSPTIPIETVNKLQSRWDARISKRETQIERRIAEICDEIGIRADFGGDPRGYTVKVHLPSGAYNTWGGKEDGYGVPQ